MILQSLLPGAWSQFRTSHIGLHFIGVAAVLSSDWSNSPGPVFAASAVRRSWRDFLFPWSLVTTFQQQPHRPTSPLQRVGPRPLVDSLFLLPNLFHFYSKSSFHLGASGLARQTRLGLTAASNFSNFLPGVQPSPFKDNQPHVLAAAPPRADKPIFLWTVSRSTMHCMHNTHQCQIVWNWS